MVDALIGHTGFIGGNIARQMKFDEFYNSKNIEDIRGRRFDKVVCAAAPGEKWVANRDPQADRDSIARLLGALQEVQIKRLTLISTVDAIEPIDSYGQHRRDLERNMAGRNLTIIRLPACFGQGLKKNALYDLMNANRTDQIALNAVYQWYPLRRFWKDLTRIQGAVILDINLVSEPISMEEIRSRFFPDRRIGLPSDNAPNYNVPSDYPEFRLSKAEIVGYMDFFLRAGI